MVAMPSISVHPNKTWAAGSLDNQILVLPLLRWYYPHLITLSVRIMDQQQSTSKRKLLREGHDVRYQRRRKNDESTVPTREKFADEDDEIVKEIVNPADSFQEDIVGTSSSKMKKNSAQDGDHSTDVQYVGNSSSPEMKKNSAEDEAHSTEVQYVGNPFSSEMKIQDTPGSTEGSRTQMEDGSRTPIQEIIDVAGLEIVPISLEAVARGILTDLGWSEGEGIGLSHRDKSDVMPYQFRNVTKFLAPKE